jgi:hypothetical protein
LIHSLTEADGMQVFLRDDSSLIEPSRWEEAATEDSYAVGNQGGRS